VVPLRLSSGVLTIMAQGIDLTAYGAKDRFTFVDGLSKLFSPSTPGPSSAAAGALSAKGGIKGIMNGISQAVRRLTAGGGKPLLILENPEFLSAALESVGVVEMGDMVMELREVRNLPDVTVVLEVFVSSGERIFGAGVEMPRWTIKQLIWARVCFPGILTWLDEGIITLNLQQGLSAEYSSELTYISRRQY
jgi:hypothetical protein